MKKYFAILITSISVFIFSGCGQKADKNDEKEYSYQLLEVDRPVKSIEYRSYGASSKFGEIIKGAPTYGNYLAEFNEAGNVTKWVSYFSDGDIFILERFVYDDENMIERVTYSSEGEQTQLVKQEFDRTGNVTRWARYDEDGNLEASCVNEYDGNHIVKSIREDYHYSDTSDVVTDVWELTYKREGDRIIETKKYNNGDLVSTIRYSKYDMKGIVDGAEFNAEEVMVESIYCEYDSEGRLLRSRSFDYLSNEESDYMIERNKKGLPVFTKDSDDDPMETHYEYEYDEKGNWIKRIEFEGVIKKPVEIVERTIVY